MANHKWMGPGRVEEIGLARVDAPEISEPSSARNSDDTKRRHKCLVPDCGRKFTKAMIAARHFNSSHTGLREDKDSWRNYVEEVVN